VRAYEFIIMPQSIKPMGLIHKPGTGPNDRFGFKNVGNNKANENFADGKKKGKSRPGSQVPVATVLSQVCEQKQRRHQVRKRRCITGVPT
jgi:hypothetical protein